MHRCRLTRRGRVLYQLILSMKGEHPTAEELYGRIRDCETTMSLATVYRTLDQLVSAGLLGRIGQRTPMTPQRYDAIPNDHPHVCCTDCGCIEDLEFPRTAMADFMETFTLPEGFEIANMHLIFEGLCGKCQREKQAVNWK